MNKKYQKKMKALTIVVILSMIGIVGLSGCTSQQKNTIKVEGAFALQPMMQKWATEYEKTHPNVTIDINANGAGAGMADALKGIANIGMVSRDIYNSEIQQGAFWVSVAKDAVVATMNSDNPVKNIIFSRGVTKQQFKDIFITGNISTWGQLVGDANITDEIIVYTRSDACGAADTWAKFMGKYVQNDIGSHVDIDRISAVNGDNALVAAVQGNRFAIGYDNTGYVYTKKLADNSVVPADGVLPVPIDLNANGTLELNENVYGNRSMMVNAIIGNVYPSPPARVENLVTLHQFTGNSLDFTHWILTTGQQYVLGAGFVPLSQATIDVQLQYLENGTRPEIPK
ncbi:MAG TPA: PstS family phosphate ABC transporter substrate-binding protein [Candidatus Thermoplasmatota archaeon]|nr:PstS family phosphate ABC transporter substrate-binding protein [Candidatus Thermoplasmatota archaeon]